MGARLDIPTVTPMTDTDLLSLTQWLSPAFPVGGYAYSHGLEWAVSEGQAKTAADVAAWINDVLVFGSGRTDAVLLCKAMDPEVDLGGLAATAQALAPSKERWQETFDQGRAFSEAANALKGTAYPPVALPVAVGRAARQLSLSPQTVAALYLHAFVSNLVSCAVRFVPLGQTEGQKVLAGLHGTIEQVAKDAVTTPLDQIASGVPGADLASMHHETQQVRIFRT